MHSFTSEDLIQYLYKETSPEMTAAIKAAIANDWSLREKMNTIAAAQGQLDTVQFSPRQKAIDQILSYAEKGLEELTPHA
jgi:hypothetical protein